MTGPSPEQRDRKFSWHNVLSTLLPLQPERQFISLLTKLPTFRIAGQKEMYQNYYQVKIFLLSLRTFIPGSLLLMHPMFLYPFSAYSQTRPIASSELFFLLSLLLSQWLYYSSLFLMSSSKNTTRKAGII